MTKFKVRTYFSKDEKKSRPYERTLRYIFNTLYRSILPLMIFYAILEWTNKPTLLTIFLYVILGFLVIYQFTWELE